MITLYLAYLSYLTLGAIWADHRHLPNQSIYDKFLLLDLVGPEQNLHWSLM